MAKNEDTSSSVDSETRDLVRGNHAPAKSKLHQGKELEGHLAREAAARREGKGR
jgi:hypothetical protein